MKQLVERRTKYASPVSELSDIPFRLIS